MVKKDKVLDDIMKAEKQKLVGLKLDSYTYRLLLESVDFDKRKLPELIRNLVWKQMEEENILPLNYFKRKVYDKFLIKHKFFDMLGNSKDFLDLLTTTPHKFFSDYPSTFTKYSSLNSPIESSISKELSGKQVNKNEKRSILVSTYHNIDTFHIEDLFNFEKFVMSRHGNPPFWIIGLYPSKPLTSVFVGLGSMTLIECLDRLQSAGYEGFKRESYVTMNFDLGPANMIIKAQVYFDYDKKILFTRPSAFTLSSYTKRFDSFNIGYRREDYFPEKSLMVKYDSRDVTQEIISVHTEEFEFKKSILLPSKFIGGFYKDNWDFVPSKHKGLTSMESWAKEIKENPDKQLMKNPDNAVFITKKIPSFMRIRSLKNEFPVLIDKNKNFVWIRSGGLISPLGKDGRCIVSFRGFEKSSLYSYHHLIDFYNFYINPTRPQNNK